MPSFLVTISSSAKRKAIMSLLKSHLDSPCGSLSSPTHTQFQSFSSSSWKKKYTHKNKCSGRRTVQYASMWNIQCNMAFIVFFSLQYMQTVARLTASSKPSLHLLSVAGLRAEIVAVYNNNVGFLCKKQQTAEWSGLYQTKVICELVFSGWETLKHYCTKQKNLNKPSIILGE